jgi:formylglycine-generating enzyme required for sulfatase activity
MRAGRRKNQAVSGDAIATTGEPFTTEIGFVAMSFLACVVMAARRRIAAVSGLLLILVGGCSSSSKGTPCRGATQPGEACIAGGTFTMGHPRIPDSRQPPLAQIQIPPHQVELAPFFIDRVPVTNGEYRQCLDSGACPDECQAQGTMNSMQMRADCNDRRRFFASYHVRDASLARYPVATVYDVGAEAYCRSVGKRLPTEAEWERAARGLGSSDYPWGNAAPSCSHYECRLVQFGDQPFSPVGAYPVDVSNGDVTPEGVRFMVTGVAEFLDDWYYDYPFDIGGAVRDPQGTTGPGQTGHSVRGNTMSLLPVYHRATGDLLEQFPLPAWTRDNMTTLTGGFRCARTDL